MFLVIFLTFIIRAEGFSEDYWSDTFDQNKNCVREEEMIKLEREGGPGRCSSSSVGRNCSYILLTRFWSAAGIV